MLKTCIASVAAALISLAALASPAEALVVRAWVSGHGSDVAGCGAPASPCRTLQYTFTNIVSAGGEIDILDPAGYGTINIDHAISIVNDGVGTAGVQAASGDAITIHAGVNDAIRLKGLNIEGLGTASRGIVFNAGASLTIEDCTVTDFASSLIQFTPTTVGAYLTVINARFERSGAGNAILIEPVIGSGTGRIAATFDHVAVVGPGSNGIFVDGEAAGPNIKIRLIVANSFISGFSTDGISCFSPANDGETIAVVRDTTLSNNGVALANAGGQAHLTMSHSAVTGNAAAFSGTIGTFGNNDVSANDSAGSSTFFPITPE